MAVKIIIDSASDIGAKEANELGVTMLPMSICFGSEEYLDGVNLTPDEFYSKLGESKLLPKTSQVTPFAFAEAFEQITKNGDEAVVITISSKLSGTYQSAKVASADFEGKVFVVDSLNAAIGERLLCEYALRLIKEGKSADEIARELDEKKTKIHLMARLDTLEYLKKGGRISAVTAFAGELLSIKPIISVIDGEVKLVGKARGSKKGNGLLTILVNEVGIDFEMPFGTVYSGKTSKSLEEYIEESKSLWQKEAEKVPMYILGGTIGTHVGPGAIGVAFFEAE